MTECCLMSSWRSTLLDEGALGQTTCLTRQGFTALFHILGIMALHPIMVIRFGGLLNDLAIRYECAHQLS